MPRWKLYRGDWIVVCGRCGGEMVAEVGGAPGGPWLLWWRCDIHSRHLSEPMPIPHQLAIPANLPIGA